MQALREVLVTLQANQTAAAAGYCSFQLDRTVVGAFLALFLFVRQTLILARLLKYHSLRIV